MLYNKLRGKEMEEKTKLGQEVEGAIIRGEGSGRQVRAPQTGKVLHLDKAPLAETYLLSWV